MPFNHDGWFFWQGSVSILRGLGYRDFTGQPITAWPPLYPVYLALCQLVLGVSARSVAISTALATAVAVASWSLLLAWFARERGRRPRDVLCALAFVSVVLALGARNVRSENLFHGVLPLLLLFTLRARVSTTRGRFLLASGLAGAALLLSLLIRNASLAFWPAVLAVLLQHRRFPWQTRAVACGLVTALALPIWLAVRAWLGQLGRHPIHLGGRYQLTEYLLQFVAGIDRNTGLQFVGLPLLILLAVSLLRADPARANTDSPPRLGRAALLFTAVAAAALLALFNLTWIHDKPENRFTLFVTLVLGGLGLLSLPALLRRSWLALALVVLFAEPTLRLAKHTIRGRGPGAADFRAESLKGFAPSPTSIDPEHFGRAPEPIGDSMLVSPPYPSGSSRIRHRGKQPDRHGVASHEQPVPAVHQAVLRGEGLVDGETGFGRGIGDREPRFETAAALQLDAGIREQPVVPGAVGIRDTDPGHIAEIDDPQLGGELGAPLVAGVEHRDLALLAGQVGAGDDHCPDGDASQDGVADGHAGARRHRIGTRLIPPTKLERTRSGGPASSTCFSLSRSCAKAQRSSSFARCAPRQTCSPRPKPMCSFGIRSMRKRNGSSKTSSSRFAEG